MQLKGLQQNEGQTNFVVGGADGLFFCYLDGFEKSKEFLSCK